MKDRHSFYQHCAALDETRQMNYNLTLKGHFENVSQGQRHDLSGKIMLHIRHSVSLASAHISYVL